MNWVVVSFYTKNTGYEWEVKKLEVSLEALNIDCHLFPCEPEGSWRQNLNHKSRVILEAFDMFPDKDIVFIDADGIVRKYPVLFDQLSKDHAFDIAAHFHPYKGTKIQGGSLLSGTLWFQNGEKGRILVAEWDKIGRTHPTIRHQHCLRVAINELNKKGVGIKIYKMPREYTLIFDYYRGGNRPEPVIEHFQASRRFRKEVGYGGGLLNSSFATLDEKKRMGRTAISIKTERVKKEIARRGRLTTQDVRIRQKRDDFLKDVSIFTGKHGRKAV